ncbi:MAG: Penicillin-binding protein [Parcubacteria group bacterium GW2011_GWD2_42_14]|nr:MAG: Penicillin-binding protein [Parcubacteria group bacterium GW2011_GWD2_42_14]
MFTRRKKQHKDTLISPEEILLDASNLPSFGPNTLEGKLNKPIGPKSLQPLILLILLTGIVLFARTGQLMVLGSEQYKSLSEDNRLGHSVLFAERGIIYDRNGIELAWNIPHLIDGKFEEYDERSYATTTGLGHILGYVRMPARDSSGVLFREGIEGVSGAELVFDEILRGKSGTKIVETDARMDVVSEGLLEKPVSGEALHLTIDLRLQEALNRFIGELAEQVPFRGGAGVIMDIETGEILAMTSYPEYSSSALISGDTEKIASYNSDPRTPYLNRTLAGQYTPGSIVKPYMASAALNEGIVKPETSFVSTGSLRLANPYTPGQYAVFTDWKAHGVVDLRRALAVSSNVYFYYIGGGFGKQEGLGISRIEKYMRMFGFGSPTGIVLEGERSGTIPSPKWKEETFPTDPTWRIGDTYNTSIGQYGFQVTPIQAVRAIAAVANGGNLLTPRIETQYTPYTSKKIDIPEEYFRIVRAGMRDGVLEGTAKGLDVSYTTIAGKTGTAEVGTSKDHVHSWVTGFFPYENPKYAFTVLMEYGPRKNVLGGVYVMRNFLDWLHVNAPEYLEN